MRTLLPTDRWRRGEWLVVLGVVVVVVGLLGPWLREDLHGGGDEAVYVLRGYGASAYAGDVRGLAATRGLGGIGHPWLELVLLAPVAAIAALVLALRAGPGRPTYGAVTGLVVAFPVAAIALVATGLRLLAFLPGIRAADVFEVLPMYQGSDDVRSQNPPIDAVVGWGGWVGLAGLLLLAAGPWVALADDRTRRRGADDQLPEPRPVPTTSPT
ncbi:hypothetical protein [Patulibacter minatonensis]|uniref:hypothetical protein n=1 Tax=Patulibacter minatonensis TaxID=298163 RepID=UPI00047A3464|nr:hypothetical protein [Patulibacter minatonensis]